MTSGSPALDQAWKRAADSDEIEALDALLTDGEWGGPLVVSMPRTGSTLLGTLFLLLHDADGHHVFDRYVHEPISPLYWEGQPIEESVSFLGGRLGPTDIVQESAYQFAAPEIARWFLGNARRPVCFVMRHPQLAWPSRWRILMREWVFSNPDDPEARRITTALDDNDFSDLGDLLTERVSQPANGWIAFKSAIEMCDAAGLEFMIVDNARFRSDPDRVLGEMCRRWGVAYEDSLTTWETLDETRPRVAMSDLAAGPEYQWYYARTLNSTGGIIRTDQPSVPLERFPDVLRGESDAHLTIDQAVAWYEELLARPEVI
jgi:hypothetical protein